MQKALEGMSPGLRALPSEEIPLIPSGLIGIEALRELFATPQTMPQRGTPIVPPRVSPTSMTDLLTEITARGKGVVMTMGKGGVGKTTVAAAIAVELASQGHRVHLTTTDPAAHLSMAVNGSLPGLQVTCIDPAAETRTYTDEVMAESGRDLDEQGKALLAEDLRSPCTEEIAVFRAFACRVDEGNDGFVVIDTAPTGHTLLLLDAAEAYHRDVARNLSYIPDGVRRLLPQLRDPSFTKVLIVTLPEATPVHEAARLQDDLQRAGIRPYAWVVNQSFSATNTRDPVLAKRGMLEARYIAEVRETFASRVALIPWQSEPPVGTDRLRQLAEMAV